MPASQHDQRETRPSGREVLRHQAYHRQCSFRLAGRHQQVESFGERDSGRVARAVGLQVGHLCARGLPLVCSKGGFRRAQVGVGAERVESKREGSV